uniref:Plastid light harvesting protein n=1 Tax=Proboscia inermis TaxID=420281 RepID=A0A7S0C5K3_9STRA|mmetsp:Transcript_33895/g.39273  ORF Transcript_33895/g.39273 Transcript_33895/m.39273 type:complete len:247 (+) Transcript_33895:583-1323(+)
MKLVLITLAMACSAAAFTPSYPVKTTSLKMADVVEMEEEPAPPAFPTINGWTADPDAFCAGLPGALAPMGNFDPLGFTKELSVEEIKRYREAEVTHGRVSMLAVVGYLVGENFNPLFNGLVTGPANTHLAQVQSIAPFFFAWLTMSIATAELGRAKIGWEDPIKAMGYNSENEVKGAFGALLRDKYYPGDIGFDPLGLKPTGAAEFAEMQTKELQNGRLAMLAAMGMIVQEQITHDTIFGTLKTLF